MLSLQTEVGGRGRGQHRGLCYFSMSLNPLLPGSSAFFVSFVKFAKLRGFRVPRLLLWDRLRIGH